MTIDQLILEVFDRFKMVLNDYFIETIAPFIDDSFAYGEIVFHMKNNPLYENVNGESGVNVLYKPKNRTYSEWNQKTAGKIAKSIVGDRGFVGPMSTENIIKFGEPTASGSHYRKNMHPTMVKNRFVPIAKFSASQIQSALYYDAKEGKNGWTKPKGMNGIFQYHGKIQTESETEPDQTTEKWPPYKNWINELYKVQFGICNICLERKKKEDMVVDHILPKTRKGLDNPDNLQLVCFKCNGRKSTKTMEEFKGLEFRQQIIRKQALASNEFVERKRYEKLAIKVQELQEEIQKLQEKEP